jgi:hypothetical protein
MPKLTSPAPGGPISRAKGDFFPGGSQDACTQALDAL